jgi:hypothetical protein
MNPLVTNHQSPIAQGNIPNAPLGTCPLSVSDYREIVLAHGSGGKLSQQLIQKIVLPQFGNELLEPLHDGAIFSLGGARLAFSTDSFVVSPIFFPGGRYRQARRAWHRERHSDVRGTTPLLVGGIHLRRGHINGGFVENRLIDASSGC